MSTLRPPARSRVFGLPSAPDAPVLIGESSAMRALRQDIANAAGTHAKILILGETGVGKEVVARLIHNGGPRSARAFLAVNCSGIPETLLESELFGHRRGSFTGAIRDKIGLLEQADSGTLFLDELGEMSLRMQAAVLRFAETGEIQQVGAHDAGSLRVDVRLIAATHRDLRERIAEGAFREDLYYRLNVLQIQIPSLRERREDIPLLMRHFLERAALSHEVQVPALSPDAERTLAEYDWPGNVRELRNVAERLALLAGGRTLTVDELPSDVRLSAPAARTARRTVSLEGGLAASDNIASSPVTDAASESSTGSLVTDALWERLRAGEDFWTVVAAPFQSHHLTRQDLRAIVHRGLTETNGSYRALLLRVNLPPTDYKKFHAFLYHQQCNLPVASYRPPRTVRRSGHTAARRLQVVQ